MNFEIPILDHGYVRFVEKWGSDSRIVESARMSTDKNFRGWGTPEEPGDEKFLKFLWDNKHLSPFEQAGMIVEVQAPIFVFREWHRHRTQSYNELSGRYTALPDLYYVPSIERLMAGQQSKGNKQSSADGITEAEAKRFQQIISDVYAGTRGFYEGMLTAGLARELARVIVPVGQYSRMRARANLRNWLSFLTLRTAANAQWEIRQYANAVASLVLDHFPRTYDLFIKSLP